MSRIYDSSAITQRRRDQAQAGSFINRIQNPNHPQTSYGPLQGNYDASIMNSVKMGQPKEFYRNSGCVIISNGCPCPPIAVDEIISGSGPTPPVILVPGPVSNVQAEYGSVIVTWDAPTTGGAPTSYTLIADDQTTLANSVTITGITDVSYTFPTYTGPASNQLTAGDRYLFKVIGNNSAGAGVQGGVSSSFYAPYVAPESDNISTNADPNTIFIDIAPYRAFTPTKYILKTYTNDVLTSTSLRTDLSGNRIVVNSGLSCLNVYTFQVQLLNDLTNQYSSFSIKDDNLPVYPAGPVITSVTNITNTTVQVIYTDYTTTGGFDLTTGDATCNINGPPSSGYDYTNLTNTSVVITGLYPYTLYAFGALLPLVISFEKTINVFDIDSGFTRLPTFTTIGPGIAPVIISSDAPTANNATIIFNAYSSTSGTPGQFDFTGATFSIPGVTIETITQPNQIYISNLVTATTYTGCTMTLTGASGAISNTSNTFTIVTKSNAPTSLGAGNLANTPVTFTFDQYTPFTSGVTTITLFATENGTTSVSLNGSNITNQSMTISALQPQATYTNAYIIIYNGGIISLPSNEISSFTMPYPNPTITVTSTKTCRTQELEFSYSTTYFTPTGVAIIAPSGVTVSALSASNPYYVTLENLTPDTTYSTIKIQLTGNSGESSQYTTITAFTTLPVTTEGSINHLNLGNVTTTTIQMTFDPFGGFGTSGGYPTGAIVTTSTGGVILPQNIELIELDGNYTGIRITGLTPGQELINPTITLTNDANCLQSNPASYGGTVRTKYPAPTDVNINTLTNNSAQIRFSQYPYFDPYVSGFSYTTVIATVGGNTNREVTISQADNTSVSLSDLSVGVLYTDVVLRLVSNTGLAAEAVTIPDFTPQWLAPTSVYSAPDGFNNTQALITYSGYSPTFGASSGTLSGISGGIITNVGNTGFTIYNLSAGTLYSQGSFFLTNNDSPPLNTGSASIPEFITNGGPFTPSNIQVGTVTTDSASITFSQYGFTPSQIICETYTGGEFISVTDVSDQSATLTGLGYPRGYNVKIRVIYNSETSQWSSPFSFNT
jgi:hypothetical protein